MELVAFEAWAAANGTPLGYRTYNEAAAAYESHIVKHHSAAGVEKAMRAVRDVGILLPAWQAESEKAVPGGTIAVRGGTVSVRDGSGALLYPGWFVRSLLTGARTGFVSGVLYAVVVLVLMRWLA